MRFVMSLEKKKIFENLKTVFTNVFLLRHFDSKIKIFLKTNVSKYVVSKILLQLIENQK